MKYDHRNQLLCYLYLENKTFINAHLIKSGFVKVDSEIDFKYKNKFLNLTHYNNGKRMDFEQCDESLPAKF